MDRTPPETCIESWVQNDLGKQEQEVEKWKATAATYAAEQEDVPESVQVWRQVRFGGHHSQTNLFAVLYPSIH